MSKEITLTEKINAVFNSGESIRLQNQIKRKDGEWNS